MLISYKEEVADQLYEKFLHETYLIKGNYCEDEISTLLLEISAENYKKKCKELLCTERL